jgi:hypothetical protein
MPDIPVPNFAAAAKEVGSGLAGSGAWDDLVNKWGHRLWDAVSWSIGFLVSGFDEIFALMTMVLTAMQGINQPGFFAMIAAVLGDLLGVEFPQAAIQDAFQKRGSIGAMQVVGGNIFDTLAGEFTTGVTAGAIAPSTAPAKAFLGFLTSFAVRQGNVALISEMLPMEVNILGGLREYGELLAKNLGLGRLARQALRPLMQILVADPLQWSLNAQYRPKLLSEPQMVAALNRGLVTRDQVNTWMSWLGYTDQAIGLLVSDPGHNWSTHELLNLMRNGQMDDATAIQLIQNRGLDYGTANRIWTAAKFSLSDSAAQTYFGVLLEQFKRGFMPAAAVLSELDTIPLLPEERQYLSHTIGTYAEQGWRHLTEAELEKAFLFGILDLTAVQTAWQRLGYTFEAIQTLTLLLLQRQSTGTKTRVGHVVHKSLSEAQILSAYENGLIDLSQAQAAWTNLGYSPQSIQLLTVMATAKVEGPGTSQLPGWTGA